ncbi:hypothetical protein [Qipengyuania oceanensis]|nr:hypothetical protein [Qipengyuania oceanensis]
MAEAHHINKPEQFVTDLGLVEAWREGGDCSEFCHPAPEMEVACK